jgi:hypothetical protein
MVQEVASAIAAAHSKGRAVFFIPLVRYWHSRFPFVTGEAFQVITG